MSTSRPLRPGDEIVLIADWPPDVPFDASVFPLLLPSLHPKAWGSFDASTTSKWVVFPTSQLARLAVGMTQERRFGDAAALRAGVIGTASQVALDTAQLEGLANIEEFEADLPPPLPHRPSTVPFSSQPPTLTAPVLRAPLVDAVHFVEMQQAIEQRSETRFKALEKRCQLAETLAEYAFEAADHAFHAVEQLTSSVESAGDRVVQLEAALADETKERLRLKERLKKTEDYLKQRRASEKAKQQAPPPPPSDHPRTPPPPPTTDLPPSPSSSGVKRPRSSSPTPPPYGAQDRLPPSISARLTTLEIRHLPAEAISSRSALLSLVPPAAAPDAIVLHQPDGLFRSAYVGYFSPERATEGCRAFANVRCEQSSPIVQDLREGRDPKWEWGDLRSKELRDREWLALRSGDGYRRKRTKDETPGGSTFSPPTPSPTAPSRPPATLKWDVERRHHVHPSEASAVSTASTSADSPSSRPGLSRQLRQRLLAICKTAPAAPQPLENVVRADVMGDTLEGLSEDAAVQTVQEAFGSFSWSVEEILIRPCTTPRDPLDHLWRLDVRLKDHKAFTAFQHRQKAAAMKVMNIRSGLHSTERKKLPQVARTYESTFGGA